MNWVTVRMPGGVELELMEHVAKTRSNEDHERLRLLAIQRLLYPGAVVYDVGAEEGIFTALYGKIVGGGNVHIFEPAPGVWPNIKATWERNVHATRAIESCEATILVPMKAPAPGCWQGFVGDKSSDNVDGLSHHRYGRNRSWPTAAHEAIQQKPSYRALHDATGIRTITIDSYAAITDCPPDFISMDIEGAEGLAVKGMRGTLLTYRPIVFLTIHPWFFFTPYLPTGDVPDTWDQPSQDYIFRTFATHRYCMQFIGLDHEAHWLAIPEERYGAVERALEPLEGWRR